MWITPTDEELFKKYNPELQKRSLEGRREREKEFDDFVNKLKEQSKSSKPSKTTTALSGYWLTQLQYGLFRKKRKRGPGVPQGSRPGLRELRQPRLSKRRRSDDS